MRSMGRPKEKCLQSKILVLISYRTVRQSYSSIIIQNPTSSIIQQFREAPSAYIFFVHELIQAFIDICNSSTMLYKIFDKLKKHFWEDVPGGFNSSPLQNNIKDKVNVETEHLALFYYHILRENVRLPLTIFRPPERL